MSGASYCNLCLSARMCQKPDVQTSWNFCVHVTCGCGSVLCQRCNALYISVFWMMWCFCIMGQIPIQVWHLWQQQQQPFYGPLSGTTQKHSPTHHPDHHPLFISFFYLPRSIASSLFGVSDLVNYSLWLTRWRRWLKSTKSMDGNSWQLLLIALFISVMENV